MPASNLMIGARVVIVVRFGWEFSSFQFGYAFNDIRYLTGRGRVGHVSWTCPGDMLPPGHACPSCPRCVLSAS